MRRPRRKKYIKKSYNRIKIVVHKSIYPQACFPMLFITKTLWKLWTRLSRNYILITVIKISRVSLNRFCSNLQGLCKNVLFSEPGGLFWRKNLFSLSLRKPDKKWGQNFQKPAICPKKNAFWLTALNRKTWFLFYFIFITLFTNFYFKIMWKLH